MKVLVVDDHPVFREGLVALLRQTSDFTEIVEADGAEAARAQIEAHPDLAIVILDLMLPGIGGMDAIAEIGRTRVGLPIIILSSSEAAADARAAFRQGALGYVPKSASRNTLASAIRLVLSGERYVPPLLIHDSPRLSDAGPTVAVLPRSLTERQIEVLRRLAAGDTNKRIALDLDLSEKTVKVHVTAIFRALGVVNRTQAARAAHAARLL